MTDISIKWQGMEYAQGVLSSIATKASNKKGLMAGIASAMKASTKERLSRDKKSPAGTPWAAYKSPSYAKNKSKRSSGGLLVDQGLLHASIFTKASNDYAKWGANRAYAGVHQFGSVKKGIVARPYIGLSVNDRVIINDIVTGYFNVD